MATRNGAGGSVIIAVRSGLAAALLHLPACQPPGDTDFSVVVEDTTQNEWQADISDSTAGVHAGRHDLSPDVHD